MNASFDCMVPTLRCSVLSPRRLTIISLTRRLVIEEDLAFHNFGIFIAGARLSCVLLDVFISVSASTKW